MPGSSSLPKVTRTQLLIGALMLAVAGLMLCLDGTRDGDLYLQLASGRFIAAHGLVSADPFQTIAHGEPWLNQQWLNELLLYQLVRWIGVTGLTVLYAGLLALPLGLLLWLCRRKGLAMMIALAFLYCPGLWMVIHPRAAGFSVLCFSLLVTIVALAWLRRGPQPPSWRRLLWSIPGTLLVFAVWANLHGGFLAGLALIGVVALGLLLERWLGLGGALGSRHIALLFVTGILAGATVLVATPLGTGLLAYLVSFGNPAIALASSEWRPAFQSPLATAYLALAAAFAGWLLLGSRRERRLVPALVIVAFLALALVSLRNIVFIGPVLALAIAVLAPDRSIRVPRSLIGLVLLAAGGILATWALTVGPARNEPLLNARLIGFALRHPPPRGHIAAYAGVGSYMLWRSPRAPVELDGWLEHFSEAELRDTYLVVDGHARRPMRYVRRLQIGAVIADRQRAIEALQADGFRVELRTHAGDYLVRTRAMARQASLRP